jgi:quercetin dioxygenase-like cupin family protein
MSATHAWTPVVNRVTGERMLVLHHGPTAEGDLLEVQFDLPPYSAGSPMHRHQRLQERFDVLDGALRVCVDGAWRTLLAGESVFVEPGQAHCFLNESGAWVTFITEVRPPHRFERFLRTWYGLANDGRSTADGFPSNPLHLARCLDDADFTFADWPATPQRLVIGTLVAIGTAFGAYASLMDFDSEPVPAALAVAR